MPPTMANLGFATHAYVNNMKKFPDWRINAPFSSFRKSSPSSILTVSMSPSDEGDVFISIYDFVW